MNDGIEVKQPVAAGNVDGKPVSDRFTSGSGCEVNTKPNWAWASSQGRYDWMDSYSPFIDVD